MLTAQQLARWRGLPVGWFAAAPEVFTRNIAWSRPLLAMIDTGQARGEFGFPGYTDHRDIGAGAIGLFNGQVEARFCKWHTRSVRRIMLDLDMGFLSSSGLAGDDLASIPWVQDIEFYDPEVAAVLRAMVGEINAGCPNGALYAQSLSIGLLLRLSRTRGATASPQRERGRLSPAQCQRLEEFIRRDLAGDLSLDSLAAATGFSASQFTRLFRNTFGQSPHRHVLLKRLEQARELVLAGSLPLAAIAEACGFSGQSHMTSVFTRELGVSPGGMQRLQRSG